MSQTWNWQESCALPTLARMHGRLKYRTPWWESFPPNFQASPTFKSTVPAVLMQSLHPSPQRLSHLPKNLPEFRKEESQAKIHASSLILLAMDSPRCSLPPIHHCAHLHWGLRRTGKHKQPWLTWVKINPGIQDFSHLRTAQKLKVTHN